MKNSSRISANRPAFRLIGYEELAARKNMAVDGALFNLVSIGKSPDTIRFYGWSAPSITLGYSQRAPDFIDLEACRDSGIGVCRRLTGGGAVLHHCELTYSVIARTDLFPFTGGLMDNYRVISEWICAGLRELGVEAEMEPARGAGGRRSSVCFSEKSSFEITARGRKIVGSAQKRNAKAFLQHGSIPLNMDPEILTKVFRGLTAGRISKEMTDVGRETGLKSGPAGLIQILLKKLPEFLFAGVRRGRLTGVERAETEKLLNTEYLQPVWQEKVPGGSLPLP